MIPTTDLREILEIYADTYDERYDSEALARFITSRSYAHLRGGRPNLAALLLAACLLLGETLGDTDLIISMDALGNTVIGREDTQEIAVGNTFIEALIHFADEVSKTE